MEVKFAKNPADGQTDAIDVQSSVVTPPASPVTAAAPAPPVTAPAAPAAPAPANPTTALTPPPQQSRVLAPSGLVLGDKLPDMSEIILPRINIVQFVGDLKDKFNPGEIVFGQATVLFTPAKIDKQTGNPIEKASPPVAITILGFRPTRFVEKVEGGGRGLIVNTEDEVRANGGTLDYNEWKAKKADGMKRFEHLAEALVAIQRPANVADDGTQFVYKADGKEFALAIWAMKGTSYTHAAKRVFFTARAVGCLREGGYPSYSYALTTRLDEFAGNKFFAPVCVPIGKNSPEMLKFVADVLGAPAPAAE